MYKVHDIETLKPLFTYTDLDIKTKEINKFVICEFQNDLKRFIEYIKQVKGLIGYNSLNFDAQVIQYIINNSTTWLSMKINSKDIAYLIYEYAQYVINKSNNNEFLDYPEWKLDIKQLDLYKIWHFNNKAKSTSLKWIEFMIDFPNIEEMPIPHNIETITKEQVEQVLVYNENDVLATYEFYLITIGQTDYSLYKGVDKIQLRKDIRKEFDINCMNFNDVKIGDEINKLIYCKLSGIDKKQLSKTGTFRNSLKVKDCIKVPIKFETDQLKLFYEDFGKVEFNPLKLKDSKDRGTEFNFKGLNITFGFGGIHTIDSPRRFETNEEYYLSDKDCTGMYPRTIIEQKIFPKHLGENWYRGCEYIYNKRANEYKPLAKKDSRAQSFSEAFKLANNGGSFGKSNESTSWQYDPLVAFSITLFNQFALLKLTEMFILNGIQVVSLNTDGCLSYVKYEQKELYERICKDWEKLSLHTLEETLYQTFIQTSVNDYLAIKSDGEIKTKGDFTSEFELHKNKSARIVPLALQAYFSKGTTVEQTILDHKNIYDFCLGSKSKSDSKLVHYNAKTNEETDLQKVNRYYISTDGSNLLKKMKALESKIKTYQLDIFGNINVGIREQEVNATWLSTIFNKYEKKEMKDYNINYDFYLVRCYKIIRLIK